MEISFYIIKPEAIQFTDEIQKLIISTGLKINTSTKILLPTTFIEELCFDYSKEIIEVTKYFLCNEICEVGIVKGDSALEKLYVISGTETDPNKCNTGTIRNLFGIKAPQIFNGIKYYKNAIHRPKTKEEFDRNISSIRRLIGLENDV